MDASISRLLNLKVARDRKRMAPNKPLLVLAILDLMEAGLVSASELTKRIADIEEQLSDLQKRLRSRSG